MTRRFEKKHSRRAIGTGHILNGGKPIKLEENVRDSELQKELQKQICPHIDYCSFRKNQRDKNEYVNCFIPESRKKYECGKIKSFYDKYPNYIEMFIGSNL